MVLIILDESRIVLSKCVQNSQNACLRITLLILFIVVVVTLMGSTMGRRSIIIFYYYFYLLLCFMKNSKRKMTERLHSQQLYITVLYYTVIRCTGTSSRSTCRYLLIVETRDPRFYLNFWSRRV